KLLRELERDPVKNLYAIWNLTRDPDNTKLYSCFRGKQNARLLVAVQRPLSSNGNTRSRIRRNRFKIDGCLSMEKICDTRLASQIQHCGGKIQINMELS